MANLSSTRIFGDGTVERSLYIKQRLGVGVGDPDERIEVGGESYPQIRFDTSDGNSTIWDIGFAGDYAFQIRNQDTSDTHVTVNPGGDVGIGTTNPQRKLHIDGFGSADIRMRNNNDSDYWELNTRNNGRFDINRGGTDYVTVASSGDVGIGTTAPSEALEVYGDPLINADGSGNGKAQLRFNEGGSGTSAYIGYDGNNFGGTDNRLEFSRDGIAMVIDGNQNVGIGTTAPSYKLEVQGDIKLNEWLRDDNNNRAYRAFPDGDRWMALDSGGSANQAGVWDYVNGEERFSVKQSGRIALLGGNVGIGTTSPEVTGLHIERGTAASDPALLRIQSSSGGSTNKGDTYAGIELGVEGGNTGASGEQPVTAYIKAKDDRSGSTSYEDGGLSFGTMDSGESYPQEQMFIDAAGKVGIGTNSPNVSLDVEGAVDVNGRLNMRNNNITSVNNIRMGDGSIIGISGSSNPEIEFESNGIEIQSVQRLSFGDQSGNVDGFDVNNRNIENVNNLEADNIQINNSLTYEDDEFIEKVSNNVGSGWYTIADNGPSGSGDRASARFILKDTTGGEHQTVHFYASVHYGNNPHITVLSSSTFSGLPFTDIRIKSADTYDGQILQVYMPSDVGQVRAYMLDNVQDQGWTLQNWVSGDTISGLSQSARVNLSKSDSNQGINTSAAIITESKVNADGGAEFFGTVDMNSNSVNNVASLNVSRITSNNGNDPTRVEQPFNFTGDGGNSKSYEVRIDGNGLDMRSNIDMNNRYINDADRIEINGAEGNEYQVRGGANTSHGISVRAPNNPPSDRTIFAVESGGNATRFGVTQTNGGFFRNELWVNAGGSTDNGEINDGDISSSYSLRVDGGITFDGPGNTLSDSTIFPDGDDLQIESSSGGIKFNFNAEDIEFQEIGSCPAIVFKDVFSNFPSNSEIESVLDANEATIFAYDAGTNNINLGWAETDNNGNVTNTGATF